MFSGVLRSQVFSGSFYCVVFIVDDNECLIPGICGQANCDNKIGSYECGCVNGQVFDPNLMRCIGK